MISIRHMTIRFDVEGDDDEQTFASLFRKYATRAREAEREDEQRRRVAARERAIGTEPDPEAL